MREEKLDYYEKRLKRLQEDLITTKENFEKQINNLNKAIEDTQTEIYKFNEVEDKVVRIKYVMSYDNYSDGDYDYHNILDILTLTPEEFCIEVNVDNLKWYWEEYLKVCNNKINLDEDVSEGYNYRIYTEVETSLRRVDPKFTIELLNDRKDVFNISNYTQTTLEFIQK